MPQRMPASRPVEDARLVTVSNFCLSLPEAAREDHVDHVTFRVRKKVFAYFLNNHHGDEIVSVCVKSESGENTERIQACPELFYLPAYIGPRGWFGMRLDVEPIDWDEVQTIVDQSYRLSAPKALIAKMK